MTFKQFILLGLPGVEVQEQGHTLAEHWHIPHISMGQLVGEATEQPSALGLEIRPYVDADALIPDALAMTLLRRRLEQPDAMLQGWVLDGFPRTLAQAQGLGDWLTAVGQPAPTVVYLKAIPELLLNRLWNQGGQQQPIPLLRRQLDDHGAALAPLLDYYQQQGQLETVNGSLSAAEVARDLAQVGNDPPTAIRWVQDEAELDELLAKGSVLVVDCMASWCGACKQVMPLINRLAETYGHQVKVMTMDFDANRQISKRFGLQGIPAVMFFKDGDLQETLTGVKSYQDYEVTLTCLLD